MSENAPEPTPAEGTGTENTPPVPPTDPPAQETTDWKAEARKHERRSKEKDAAVDELAKLKASMQTDTEKAITKAKAEGATEASKTFGTKLAAAEFKAAVAAKGLDLGDALDLIDTTRFVTEQGDVDQDAIKKAVAKLAKLKPSTPAVSGGEFSGAPGEGQPITEEQLARMTPEQTVKALEEGKLAHLL